MAARGHHKRPDVARWWCTWPDAVPGIELGRTDLIIIDTDRHGAVDGVANFAALVAQHVPLANHPIAKTAGGGEHHYFKQWRGESFGNSEGALRGKGIDVRGKGGWVVAPGSVRSDGKRWQPAGLAAAYRNNAIPILPDWIAAMIRPAHKAEAQTKQSNEQQPDRPPWSEAEDARVQHALKRIPSDDRDTWLRIGAALHWTGWPTARGIWDAWSQTTPGRTTERRSRWEACSISQKKPTGAKSGRPLYNRNRPSRQSILPQTLHFSATRPPKRDRRLKSHDHFPKRCEPQPRLGMDARESA
jgi:Bifunctional DNA primase/polymerase, N-terminal/Primase C terminal 2 (PriCT-2)